VFFFLYSYGLIRAENSEDAFFWINVPRNVASNEVQSYYVAYGIFWSGDICPKVLNATCSDSETDRLPSGEYRIRFSALKHFGNSTNPDDFEVYHTPVFYLVY
jgi:hypothetical protein